MMNKHKSGMITLAISLLICTLVKAQHVTVPLAPEQYRKPVDYSPLPPGYSVTDLKKKYSEEMRKRSSEVNDRIEKVNEQGKWKPVSESINQHKAPEWFLDAKFGMFIDWGLWSIAGWAPENEKGPMYPDWYEFRLHTDPIFMAYHEKNWGKDFERDDFIPLFQAKTYRPDKLMHTARQAGMKYVIPFSKHHSGFCLWPSSFTLRDAGDMGPGRDLIKPLVENCRKEGLKFGFYFSVEEWEYPLIGNNNQIFPRLWSYQNKPKPVMKELDKKITGKIPVRDFAKDYLVPQAVEFIDRYDPDLLWFDGEWLTEADELKTVDIASYFYNQAEGRKEVAVNDRYGTKNGRGLRFESGDFYTSEYHSLEDQNKKSFHAWEECRGISQSFGFNWQDTGDNVITSKAFIDMFIDIVAHGGNLLLVVNLDGQGALPAIQEKRLKDIGKWLSVNGEGIYATRPFSPQNGNKVSFTQSKDGQFLYAILKEWPGKELKLEGVQPAAGSKIAMLGTNKSLDWTWKGNKIIINLPDKLQNNKNRPCEHAWVIRIKIS